MYLCRLCVCVRVEGVLIGGSTCAYVHNAIILVGIHVVLHLTMSIGTNCNSQEYPSDVSN